MSQDVQSSMIAAYWLTLHGESVARCRRQLPFAPLVQVVGRAAVSGLMGVQIPRGALMVRRLHDQGGHLLIGEGDGKGPTDQPPAQMRSHVGNPNKDRLGEASGRVREGNGK